MPDGPRSPEAPRPEMERSESSIQPVIDRMASIPREDGVALLAEGKDDPANIRVSQFDIDPVRSAAGQDYYFFAAEIKRDAAVNPHFHLHGEEPYIIHEGQGEMYIGKPELEEGRVDWQEPRKVGPGDVIEVQEGQVHSLVNKGEDSLIFFFSCPIGENGHLADKTEENPEGDRQFTMHLKDGIPPGFPKQ